MVTMWIVTRDSVPFVAQQTGYTEEELHQILDAYVSKGEGLTLRVAKKHVEPARENPGQIFRPHDWE